MDIDIFLIYLYELCTKYPVHSTISSVCVVGVSCWCTYKISKNRTPKDQINRNHQLIKQQSQIEELKTAKQEIAARNAFLSDKIIDLEEENEEFKKIHIKLNQTIQDLESQTGTVWTPIVLENTKKKRVSNSKSKTLEELGFDALMERNFDKALEYFNEAIKKNPYNSNTHDYIGIAYSNKGKYDEAIEACQTAIDLNCEDATAFYVMGFAYQKLGYQDKADECFQIKDIIGGK